MDEIDEVLENIGEDETELPDIIPEQPNESKTADTYPGEYEIVAESAITKVADTNTRGEFKEDAKFKGLRDSIAAEGIFVPLFLADDGDGTYTLIAGTRRLRA
ncbi:unnamed protein product, partial [marine sediment metagenome]